jgi:molybdenum cofactor cytidylyltransferase
MSRVAIVILAAGGSVRLGRPKQLLLYQGQSLLRRAARTALEAACGPVAVVLGAHADQMLPEIADLTVTIVHNVEWESGMGSSLRCGLESLLALSGDPLEAVIVMLCDQPHVSPELLRTLAEHNGAGGIVACEYNGTVGVPALFSAALFEELRKLPSDAGAKVLLARHRDIVTRIPFPEGAIDIDTAEDYTALQGLPR